MGNQNPESEPADAPNSPTSDPAADESWVASRRRVLAGIGGAGVALGIGSFASQQQTEYRLGGRTAGWMGRSPQSIADQENPTLELQVGQQYSITWENLDGQPHNVVIRSADGTQLVRSELVSEQGATQTVTFTATQEMASYLCEVHPNTMAGEITTGGGNVQTTTQDQQGEDGFFQQGARVGVQTVAEGMTAPTDYAVPNDGSGRRFVTDQTGEVWVVTDQGRQSEPFLNVSDRMVELGQFNGSYASQGQAYDERGLLGMDFHPDFQNNRKFYLHYSAPPNQDTPDGWDHVEVVSEFTAAEDLSSASLDSECKLLQIQSPQYNHDSGPMAFGPDGYLYVPMGDGGGADDDMYGHVEDWYDQNAGGNGQDVVDNLMGSVLRIDVDTQEGDETYGVPEDNPFVGTEAQEEIWAYGFRNPYGISFDSDGNMFVADAGQNLWEEASVVERGGNYGWNVKEGTHCFSTENPSEPQAITDCPTHEPDQAPYDGSPLVDPVVEFPQTYQGTRVGITIVGGHRYEASTVPALQGKYIFGVWTQDPARNEPAGRILAATPPSDFGTGGDGATTTPGTTTDSETTTAMGTTPGNETTPENGTTTTGMGGDVGVPRDSLWDMEELVVDGEFNYFVRMFGQGSDGEVYVLVNREGVPEGDTGALLKLVPPGDGDGQTGCPTPTETETTTTETTTTETTTTQSDGAGGDGTGDGC